MRYTLLLDSTNTFLTVGLADNNSLIDSVSYECWQSQSEKMIPEIDILMSRHNVTRQDISAVMVTIGPGSYTGVRIAITVAKTITYCLNVPIYTLSSLHVMKYKMNPTICLINARSGRSYFGVYQNNKVIVSDRIMKNEDVMKYINDHQSYLISGDVSYLGLSGITPDIAFEMFSLKDYIQPVDNPLSIVPTYLKD